MALSGFPNVTHQEGRKEDQQRLICSLYCHAKFEHGEINRYEDEGDDDTNYKNKDWFQCVV